ncbi:hypothetical protein BCR39DRAFT_543514 [Naematelia encephala]|uniref:W2 domain-containing protein n=1 Tax=Naematelia encephala TaxID=71784 RepID=A0A1Y2ASW7_9TREE|nr:hypothetical protein BCR39DRAFT_543514 [Naematelia encephala]
MSHTPTSTGPGGNALAPNQSAAQDKKPSLAGVRVRQRKGQAKASAKFEPESFRDSFLLHLALLPSPLTTDALVAKLVQAGTTLEYLKYNEQFFELLFVGGLLQPGGAYLDDKRSPVYIVKTDDTSVTGDEGRGEDSWKDGVKGMVEVLKRVIQRYKYLQKPLEEDFLPNLLGYLGKWDLTARAKLAEATALLILELGASPKCLQSLAKDHVVKDGVALSFLSPFFKTYLSKQNVEHLGSTLRRSGLRDLLLVFPIQTRDRAHLEEYFKKEGLQPIIDWYAKLASLEAREQTINEVGRLINDEETNEQIIEFIKNQQVEKPAPEADLCEWIWQGLMKSIDWSARPDQLDQAVILHLTARAPILEAFCNGAKAQIGLINAIQVYCYTDTRIIKAFAQIVKVLYNADVISDQAIIYWHQKGAKPQGKQHFLKATEAMVKFLEEQESDEEE